MAGKANRAAEERESVETAKCGVDAAYFTTTYCVIDNPQGETISLTPFNLWPEQVDLMWRFMTERLMIVLKARQLGISWLACAYVLWTCIFQEGRVVLLFSKGQLEANELTRRILVMYERLPDWFRSVLPRVTRSTTSEIEWENGSIVRSLPATESAGRTFTASLLIMDEFAFMQFASTLYTSVKPTIDGGGRLIIVSTANGTDNLFYTLWTSATEGVNNFVTAFLPWWVRPGRDAKWRRSVENDAQFSWQVAQEYPSTADEAFQATGNEKFLPDILWWDNCIEALPPLARNQPVVLAADAGVGNDSFAIVGVSRHPDRSRKGAVAVRYVMEWKPPRNGLIDFNLPFMEVERLCARKSGVNVSYFCYDPYQLHYFATQIQSKGIVITDAFPQQTKRLEADKGLLDLITQRMIAHDGNRDLRAHIANADKKPDSDKLRIVKREPRLKIDLCVALSMAAYKCLELPL